LSLVGAKLARIERDQSCGRGYRCCYLAAAGAGKAAAGLGLSALTGRCRAIEQQTIENNMLNRRRPTRAVNNLCSTELRLDDDLRARFDQIDTLLAGAVAESFSVAAALTESQVALATLAPRWRLAFAQHDGKGAATRAAIIGITAALERVFDKFGPDVAGQIRAALPMRAARLLDIPGPDDNDATAASIAADVDLSGLDDLIAPITAHLKAAGDDSGRAAFDEVAFGIPTGAARADAVDQLAALTGKLASDRAAEMVGRKWIDGKLVDNPDSEHAISDSTRDMLRDVISSGLYQGETAEQIEIDILSSTIFSPDRAALIAKTEISSITNDVALGAFRQAQGLGIPLQKSWIVGSDDPCDDCAANAADGPIDLDDTFSSGDDAPPQHPRCGCSLVSVTPADDNASDVET
jgi:hypothetical protein